MKTLSLFSGCGGLDLGLEAAVAADPVAFVEQDEHCIKVLRHHRPDVRVISDVRNIDQIEARRLGGIELVCGGFPCQDLSYAGRGAGLDGDRSGLWFAMRDVVVLLEPRLVLIENVPGLLNRGLGVVLHGLAQAGYVGRWFSLGAVDVGAPHRRMRVFVTARRVDVSDVAPLTGGDIVGLYDDAGWLSPQESLLDRETISKFPKNGRWTLDAVYGDPDGVEADDSVLLPTPQSSESTPTDEFMAEVVEAGVDPEKRLYLPGRKWHVQRTLSRVVPATMAGALLPTPGANDGNGGEGATRAARQEGGKTGGAALRDLPHLIPTPSTSDAKGPSPNHGGTTAEAIRDLNTHGQAFIIDGERVDPDDVKLLPTPVVTDSFGSRRSTARTEEWVSNPGTTLTDAIWETQGRTEDTQGKLLPTPRAQDGQRHGAPTEYELGREEGKDLLHVRLGRLEKDERLLPTPTAESGEYGVGGSGTDRLGSGTFAGGGEVLLPTPTGGDVAAPRTDGPLLKDALLPTPVANPDNPGAGGELRAAVVHGEGRRNETGIDTLGRPNDGRPSRKESPLLPTPAAAEGGYSSRGGDRQDELLLGGIAKAAGEGKLLPTPTAADDNRMPDHRHKGGNHTLQSAAFEVVGKPDGEGKLLPTPQAADGDRVSEQGPRFYEGQGDNPTLLGAARRATGEALLPTPQKSDGDGGRLDRDPVTLATGRRPSGSKVGVPLATAVDKEVLLPTPKETANRASRRAMVDEQQWASPQLEQVAEMASGELPREFDTWDEVPGSSRTMEPQPLPSPDDTEIKWGVYEPAIRRWENTIGRPAPAPTDEKGRLSPAFVGWMMGMPEGWVDVPGVKRTAKLRMLGNAVQVQVGYVAGMAVLELDRELAVDDPAAAA